MLALLLNFKEMVRQIIVVSTTVSDLEELAPGLQFHIKQEILSTMPKDDPGESTLEESREC